MKTFKSLFVAFVCMMVSNVALADDRPIPVEQLPASAKTFVTNNFQGKKILYAEKDWNSYECRLDDGTKIEFTAKGDWKQVDRHRMSAVPTALVPAAIKQYVNSNYGNWGDETCLPFLCCHIYTVSHSTFLQISIVCFFLQFYVCIFQLLLYLCKIMNNTGIGSCFYDYRTSMMHVTAH